MEECQRCKQLESIVLKQAELIREHQKRIEELERMFGLRDERDEDDSADSGGSGYLGKVKAKKPGKQFGKKKIKKRRGARKGHKGHGRQKCEVIDREVDLTLDSCPDCGGELLENSKPVEHVQEDLVIKKVATKYTVHRYECPCCSKGFTPEFEPGFIGPTAKSLSVLLHYYSGVTFNKIKEFYGWFGLDVSEGSLALWGRKFCEKFESSYNSLKDLVRQSGYVNVDETGWPIDGANHWLWVFRNEDAVFYRIDESRGSGVVKDVLGEDYQGVLESDFYSAYNPVDCRKQKCLVHLLRAVREWKDSDDFEKRSFHYGLNRVIDDAKKLADRRETLQADVYDEKVAGFLSDYEKLLETNFSDKDCARLMKRLRKHGNDLWTFLREPVPWHNNSAELAIRRVVVNRKVSNGNRSSPGARVQEVILSIIQTAKQQGKNLIETLLNEQELIFDSA